LGKVHTSTRGMKSRGIQRCVFMKRATTAVVGWFAVRTCCFGSKCRTETPKLSCLFDTYNFTNVAAGRRLDTPDINLIMKHYSHLILSAWKSAGREQVKVKFFV
jgi:hypothetical protein